MNTDHTLILKVAIDAAAPQTYVFEHARITFGKSRSNVLTLESSYVSRFHGELTYTPDGWICQDYGSRNRTKVRSRDGELTLGGPDGPDRCPLFGGETLLISNVRIDVEMPSPITTHSKRHLLHSTWTSTQARVLFDSLEVRGRRTVRHLFEGMLELAACDVPEEVFDALARIVSRALNPASHLLVLESPSPELRQWHLRWFWSRDAHPDEAPPSFSQTLLNLARERNESIHFTFLADGEDASLSAKQARILSSICAPIRSADILHGFLQADCRMGPRQLEATDLHLITLLAEQAGAVLDRCRATNEMKHTLEGLMDAVIAGLEQRKPASQGHAQRVANWCAELVCAINKPTYRSPHPPVFSPAQAKALHYAALLHDLGELLVPEEVLHKAQKVDTTLSLQIQHRFQLARLEAQLRFARRMELRTQENGERSYGPDFHQEEGIAETLQWLEQRQEWLSDLIKGGQIGEHDLPQLRQLTQPIGSLRLLEPEEVELLRQTVGTLNPLERQRVKEHAGLTRQLLEQVPWPASLEKVPRVAAMCHERLNGQGYPEGLQGDEIPLEGRILALCDAYDALTEHARPDRAPVTSAQALEILEGEARAGLFDGGLVRLLRQAVENNKVDKNMPPES